MALFIQQVTQYQPRVLINGNSELKPNFLTGDYERPLLIMI